ncbi:lim homeobox protein, putative, partial [Ixodes scapularis]|uniref:Lim homeobox protein, putative n=2 Tax=Ixodes scapularis TaxID=6945 RepID=A0A1S4M1H9_IXOSC
EAERAMPVISSDPDDSSTQSLRPSPGSAASPPATAKLCAACGAPIADRFYLLAVERQWHTHCLRCCHCKQQLDSELTCFARDGNIYCKEDYYSRYPRLPRCADLPIDAELTTNKLVLSRNPLAWRPFAGRTIVSSEAGSDNKPPPSLLLVAICFRHLTSEERGTPVTRGYSPSTDAASFVKRVPHPPPPPPPTSTVFSNGSVPSVQHVQHANHPSRLPQSQRGEEGVSLPDLASLDGNGPSALQQQQQQQQRTKRMRTSFKHHQLRTMKSYFAINQNPDAKDLKQLAQKTGLSKRVLQVWFQNARAKWRRNNLRQQEQPTTSLPASSPGGTSSFSEPSPGAPLDYSSAQTTLVVTAS